MRCVNPRRVCAYLRTNSGLRLCLCLVTPIAFLSSIVVVLRFDYFGYVPSWTYDATACFEPNWPAAITPYFHQLMDEFHRLCARHNLTYIPMGGTLLGVYRHGGKIPWDDDIDVLVPWDEQTRLAEALAQSDTLAFSGYKPFDVNKPNSRVYLRHHSFGAGNSRYGWSMSYFGSDVYPYIDTFSYFQNATNIWAIYYMDKQPNYAFHKDEIFPLVSTTYDYHHIFAPERKKLSRLMKKMNYDCSICENTQHYGLSHSKELFCYNVRVPCKKLEKYYTFLPGTV